MITLIKDYIQCDECGARLGYDKFEDTYVSFNWNHRYKVLYLNCPKCGNAIAIERLNG